MFQHVEQHDLGSVTVESGYITVYDANGTLDGGDVLPGFTLPVSAIFRR